MKQEKTFEKHIRGWFPQEPTLQAKSVSSVQDKMTPQQQTHRHLRVVFGVVTGLMIIFLGIIHLLTRQYFPGVVNCVGGALLLVLAYGIQKYNLNVRPRFVVATSFIILGAFFFFFNEIIIGLFAFPALFAVSLLGTSGGVAIFMGLVTALLTILTIVAWLLQKERLIVSVPDNPATKRQLLKPLAAAAILLFSTYLVIISGLEYEYAIPLTFLIIGFLILRGLGRFAKITPTFLALLACMVLLGTAASGVYTVAYVPENHYLAAAMVPNSSVVNVTVTTMQADIWVYFTNDNSQICQVAFVRQYGPTEVGRGSEFHSKSNYDGQPANNFNYSVQNDQVIVLADSYRTLVNITLNQNLKYNLDFFTYFGGITINNPQGVTSIQSSNFTSQWGYVHNPQLSMG